MNKCYSYIFLLVIFQNLVFSQDSAIIKYYPLAFGNKWVYQREQSYYPGPGKDVSTVESTFVSGNHRYYIIRNVMYLSNGTVYLSYNSTQRIDSLTGNVHKWDSSGECLIDSLKSGLGDSALSCLAWGPTGWFFCMDTNNYSIFGQNPKSKDFISGDFEFGVERRYAKSFGIVFKRSGAVMNFIEYYLRGCVISGILYGDTTLDGISQVSNKIPNQFSLSQNYPNPFNPTTKIRFNIPPSKGAGGMMTQLAIYDILGREAAVLVNEQLKPGTYEVNWNGSNYPSGVYFCKLTSADYSAAIKLILLK